MTKEDASIQLMMGEEKAVAGHLVKVTKGAGKRRVQTSCDGRGDERVKLYAIYDKDGNRVSLACEKKWQAWMYTTRYPTSIDAAIKRAKRAGYTCEEVEIVRKGKQ